MKVNDVVSYAVEGQIAVVTVDSPPVNALSNAVRQGVAGAIQTAIGDAGGNILSAATQTSSQGVARLRFLVAISDASLLDALLATVSRVASVYDARRIMPGEGANQMKRRA